MHFPRLEELRADSDRRQKDVADFCRMSSDYPPGRTDRRKKV